MTGKLTFALPVVWQPDREGNTAKQIASSGREVVALSLVASGAAATVELYDGLSDDPTSLRWVLDSSQQDTDRQQFAYPLFFKKGIYAKLVSGSNFNPVLCLAILSDQV